MKRLTILAASLALGAMACAAPTQQPSQTNDNQPKSGGYVNVRAIIDPFDWDLSYVGKSSPNGWGQATAYESLLGFKDGEDVKYHEMVLEPQLAESWEVSPDARTYTFHLRKGVKWADMAPVNGREFTSADVKWSYEYWTRTGWAKDKNLPQGQFDAMFEGITGIETPDPYTAVVKFKDPFVPFVAYAASDYNPIVPNEIYDQDGHLHDKIAGTGAFQLDTANTQKGTRWVWKKNANYRQPGKPYLDQVRWVVVPDDAAAVAAFQAKQVDQLESSALSRRTVDDISKSSPDAIIYPYQLPVGWHLYLQVQKPPFNDVRIRKALAYSIDRDELSLTLDGAKSGWAPSGAMLGLFTDEEAHQMLRYDPAEAKKLLTEAGFPNGIDITWEFPGKAYGDNYISGIELMQAQAKKAGINFTLKSIDKDAFSSKRKLKDFSIHMVSNSCGGLNEEYDAVVYGCYKSGSKGNYADVQDPQLDGLLNAERAETNPEKRIEALRAAVRRINEQVYAINTVYQPRWEVWASALHGYRPHLGSKGQNMTGAWVTR